MQNIKMPVAKIRIASLPSFLLSLHFSIMSFEKPMPIDTREIASQFAATLHSEAPAHQSKDYALLQDPVVHSERLDTIRRKKGYIIDMDGVIYHVSNATVTFKKKVSH
jgi:hypothetical protein